MKAYLYTLILVFFASTYETLASGISIEGENILYRPGILQRKEKTASDLTFIEKHISFKKIKFDKVPRTIWTNKIVTAGNVEIIRTISGLRGDELIHPVELHKKDVFLSRGQFRFLCISKKHPQLMKNSDYPAYWLQYAREHQKLSTDQMDKNRFDFMKRHTNLLKLSSPKPKEPRANPPEIPPQIHSVTRAKYGEKNSTKNKDRYATWMSDVKDTYGKSWKITIISHPKFRKRRDSIHPFSLHILHLFLSNNDFNFLKLTLKHTSMKRFKSYPHYVMTHMLKHPNQSFKSLGDRRQSFVQSCTRHPQPKWRKKPQHDAH